MRRGSIRRELDRQCRRPGEPICWAGDAATRKVASCLTPLYRKWIMASRLCILSSVGPDGTDGSPRGDDGPAVLELDEQTLEMPD